MPSHVLQVSLRSCAPSQNAFPIDTVQRRSPSSTVSFFGSPCCIRENWSAAMFVHPYDILAGVYTLEGGLASVPADRKRSSLLMLPSEPGDLLAAGVFSLTVTINETFAKQK